jgi:uncharacterized protein
MMKAEENFRPYPETSLPIFYKLDNESVLFYAPGYLLRIAKHRWNHTLKQTPEWQWLQGFAQKAMIPPDAWQNEFNPISLHIYLTQSCNLACSYCFSKAKYPTRGLKEPSIQSILAAVKLVAKNCKKLGVPMTFVCHGGGEPALSEQLESVVNSVRDICERFQVPVYCYIATNGAISPQKAQMICELFDLVGLSCDGPPHIQNQQRPMIGGKNSASSVEETAAIFHKNSQPFEVRVTLTKNSWKHMISIAEYLINQIQPNVINVELAYKVSPTPLQSTDVDDFIKAYFSAKDLCGKALIDWKTSTIRPSQIHRQYCHILQDTLQIIAGDVASLCFLDYDKNSCSQHKTQIGYFDSNQKIWAIDHERISEVRRKVLKISQVCEDCFISNHCHRSCPDKCPIDDGFALPDLHCQFNKMLMTKHLDLSAQQLTLQCANHDLWLSGMEIKAC